MSSVKEYMHEMWSQVDAEVSFTCPHCGNTISKWLRIAADVQEQFDEVACDFDQDEDAWTVVIKHEHHGWSAELEDDPNVHVAIKVDDRYEDWDEPEPEPNAFAIFRSAMADWKANVMELSTPFGASSRNRMLFTTLYSILEAYLSDAIIGVAMEEVSVRRRMLELDDLKDKKIKLETILDTPDIVKETVKTTLQKLSFHNLQVINGICQLCFGFQILPRDKDERSLVMKSIDKRHDCVHRNGRTEDGKEHDDITSEYLNKVSSIFESMAETLENVIRDTKVKIYFESVDPMSQEIDQEEATMDRLAASATGLSIKWTGSR